MLQVPWFAEFDWQSWIDSSASLQKGKASTDYEVPAAQTINKRADVDGSDLADTRKLYTKELTNLLVEIRRRGYSIRTEQAYEAWVARFIGYCENRSPDSLKEAEIVSFLQYLAVRRGVSAPAR